MEELRAVLCPARDAPSVLRRGGIAAVAARYGARREGLFVKIMCRDAGKLAAWLRRLGIAKRPCPGGSTPHLDLAGKEAREALAKTALFMRREGERGCERRGGRAAS